MHETFPEKHEPGFSESELEVLQGIYRKTVSQGYALFECESREQAERWADFLDIRLPAGRGACVVREREVNTYTYGLNHKPREPEDEHLTPDGQRVVRGYLKN